MFILNLLFLLSLCSLLSLGYCAILSLLPLSLGNKVRQPSSSNKRDMRVKLSPMPKTRRRLGPQCLQRLVTLRPSHPT
ncbi:uncharacterized protein BDW43DRAFT_270428 [Aspergillus alliaceus]|uniref:uncharacterized protein n=1 Tax=Petromyces alliaceus TaxID=209559 RepID=UPI0012A4F410|nr:uncharacterized protein BDW43DRAFT_270428 [Aspergillus alliaceus]KAB8235500.1 hypothetical protein BDW43DRAFT_270428 [Aspergillus alliaceus]